MTRVRSPHRLPPTRRDGLRVSVHDDQATIVDPSGGEHRLNATAYALWVLCDGETTAVEMVEAVRALFGVDLDTAARDVTAALQRFDETDLIDWRDAEGGA